ncbi:hypothetical protein GIB67_042927 [Kingdonia uniflora]|uniref:Pentatricopeptide repeat-containing protein n=1 Tax=Kingdonia uniflora TaxID=39325 RepID=A0A7J7KVS0_9MAGN|nr:hypothetical protein GIB67_042927 [Kingdonia uniflora]
MGTSPVMEVSTFGRSAESNNEESDRENEVGVVQFPDFFGQLVSYPLNSDVFRKFCKSKDLIGGRWGNFVKHASRQFQSCIIESGEGHFFLLADLEKEKSDRALDESISLSIMMEMSRRYDEEPMELLFRTVKKSYVDCILCKEELKIFRDMQLKEEIEAGTYTLGSALAACSDLTALIQGKEIHSYAISRGLSFNTFDTTIWNALVLGYSRSNQIVEVQELVLKIKINGVEPNIYTSNGIITGKEGIAIFSKMQEEGVRPDGVAFLFILSSCVHEGLVELVLEYFNLMRYYNVELTLKILHMRD